MFKRIDHIELVTRDAAAAERFYTEVLGFKVRSRDRIAGPVTLNLAYLDLGGTTVELISYEGLSPGPAPEAEHFGYRLMALEVEDMPQALDMLRKRGIEPSWGPRTGKGYARAEILDPEGNRIELRHWTKS